MASHFIDESPMIPSPVIDLDLLKREPSRNEKLEMKLAIKSPSEWLKLLCKEWAEENANVVFSTDSKFRAYKSFPKGLLSSQLLCRLTVYPDSEKDSRDNFWKILGVENDFDRDYISSQIEKFCSLFGIRASGEEESFVVPNPGHISGPPPFPYPVHQQTYSTPPLYPFPQFDPSAGKAYTHLTEKQDLKRNRETMNYKKVAERAAREAARDERRKRKVELREIREKKIQEQKEAALKRAAELVQSNRVPIELTRGALSAMGAANAAVNASSASPVEIKTFAPEKKSRSNIVVSTAHDLQQIVTHSRNLWAKYNAIAQEHNQKVNWITVSKELGIHVKVREKYTRMYNRAEQRGFDFVANGHYKIKDYPEIFLEPLKAEEHRGAKAVTNQTDGITDEIITTINNEPLPSGLAHTILSPTIEAPKPTELKDSSIFQQDTCNVNTENLEKKQLT